MVNVVGGTLRGLIECSFICHSMQVIYGGFGGFNRSQLIIFKQNPNWNQLGGSSHDL